MAITEDLTEIEERRLAANDEGWGRLTGRYHLLDLGRTRIRTFSSRWTVDSTVGQRPRRTLPDPMFLIRFPRHKHRKH